MRVSAITWIVCLLSFPCVCGAQSSVFPYGLPKRKPDMPLSKAMERAYTRYMSPTTWGNELLTKFRHTPLEGLDDNGGDFCPVTASWADSPDGPWTPVGKIVVPMASRAHGTHTRDLERSKMDRIRQPFWQTDTAVSANLWGYVNNHL